MQEQTESCLGDLKANAESQLKFAHSANNQTAAFGGFGIGVGKAGNFNGHCPSCGYCPHCGRRNGSMPYPWSYQAIC